jgi:hypothetical protein
VVSTFWFLFYFISFNLCLGREGDFSFSFFSPYACFWVSFCYKLAAYEYLERTVRCASTLINHINTIHFYSFQQSLGDSQLGKIQGQCMDFSFRDIQDWVGAVVLVQYPGVREPYLKTTSSLDDPCSVSEMDE